MKPSLSTTGFFLIFNLAVHGQGDEASAAPPPGFGAEHYRGLWTSSPFAIATPEAVGGSADFALVGMAQFDGVSYASLIDKGTREHFVLSSNKPDRGLTLVAVSRDQTGPTATIQRASGELMTLKEEKAPPTMEEKSSTSPTPPVANSTISAKPTGKPHPHVHRRVITVPPPPLK